MKTINKTYNVFSFDELTKDQQQKALDVNRLYNVEDPHWSTPIEWSITDELKENGYNNSDLRFSGFYSQGDGASFTCAEIDLVFWCEKNLTREQKKRFAPLIPLSAPYSITASIDRSVFSTHYIHEQTINANVDTFYLDNHIENEKQLQEVEDLCSELETLLTEDARERSRNAYEQLKNEFDYLTSDEGLRENFINNDFLFFEGGTIYYE
jgi:hypothetical protein